MCVIYIFMLFLSLRFLCGFFLYHLGIDLQSLEVGRFFPIPVSLCLGSLPLHWESSLMLVATLFDNTHSDMVLLIVHSHVTWLQAEQTVSSLHHRRLFCSIKDS